MRLFLLLLLSFLSGFAYGQGSTPKAVRIDILPDTVNIVVLDGQDQPVRGQDGGLVTLDKVSFGTSGGELQVKNSTGLPIRFGLLRGSGTSGVTPISNPINLADNAIKIFPFGRTGTLTDNSILLTDLKATPVTEMQVRVTDPGVRLLNVNLTTLLQRKESLVKQATAECQSCEEQYPAISGSIIYYDFACKCFYRLQNGQKKTINLSKLRVKSRDAIQFHIHRVNRYLYDVEVESTDVSFDSEMPGLLRNFFIGDSTKLLGNLMDAFSKNSVAMSTGGDDSELGQAYQRFLKAYKDFIAMHNRLKALKNTALKACTDFPNCCTDEIGFSEEDLFQVLADVQLALMDLQMKVKDDELVADLKKRIEENKKILASCSSIRSLSGKLQAEKNTEEQKKLQGQIDEEKKICPDEPARKAAESSLASLQTQLTLYNNLDKLQADLPDEASLNRLYLYANNIRTAHNEFITPPIYATGNRMEFVFRISPVDSVSKLNLMPLYNDSAYYDIPVLWKSFVSFSSGSFIAPQRYLQNKTYEWRHMPSNGVADSTYYMLSESGYSPQPVGFSAFLHGEIKALSWLGFGPSIGVGLTIESKPRLAYLAGGSLFFGDLKQIAITGGIAAMQMDRLNTTWQAVADQKILYGQRQSLEYYKETRTGWFVAVTYTPFNVTRRALNKSGKR